MNRMLKGKQSILFDDAPYIISSGSIVGKKEGEGPLGNLFDKVEEEIRTLKKECGDHVLKVIIETCYLTEEEKIAMCKAVTNAGADYIKTSTGFGTGGATKEDVELFRKHIGYGVKIKAAGGVSTLDDLQMFLDLGCDRIGTSRAVGLCKGQETSGY